MLRLLLIVLAMMAAAVVPDPTFSAASKWTHPTPDYEYYAKHVGAPTPTSGTVLNRQATITTTTLVNLATPSKSG